MTLTRATLLALVLLSPAVAAPQASSPARPADPLALGKAAMHRHDFTSARDFFSHYVAENPRDLEAILFLGGSQMELKQFAEAAKTFRDGIALSPDAWVLHQNLAMSYAQLQDWKAFDSERAILKAARDAHKPGLVLNSHDVLDVLYFRGETYQVWYFYTLFGPDHSRYVVVHVIKDPHPDYYMQCESNDADLATFQKSHPTAAAAGVRPFALHSFTRTATGMAQATHVTYPDGEPTYEQVRADVLKALAARP